MAKETFKVGELVTIVSPGKFTEGQIFPLEIGNSGIVAEVLTFGQVRPLIIGIPAYDVYTNGAFYWVDIEDPVNGTARYLIPDDFLRTDWQAAWKMNELSG